MLKKLSMLFAATALMAAAGGGDDIAVPELTQAQMYEDYDYMVKTLHEIMPTDIPIREIYGIDVWRKLAAGRAKIAGLADSDKFPVLVSDALLSCRSSHLGLIDMPLSMFNHPCKYWDPEISLEDVAVNHARLQRVDNELMNSPFPDKVPVTYWDGAYYTSYAFKTDGREFPAMLKLTSVDGRPIEEIELEVADNLYRFDAAHKRFFAGNFYADAVPKRPGERSFEFMAPDGKKVALTVKDDAVVERVAPARPIYTTPKLVLYLPERKTIYIRVPEMNSDDIGFYRREIGKVMEEHRPRFAVIDIRRNGGGSDRISFALAAALLKEFRCVTTRVVPDCPMMRGYLRRHHGFEPTEADIITVPFLGDRKFIIQPSDNKYSKNDGSPKVEHVYVVEHEIYSASAAMMNIAADTAEMTSIGWPNPKTLGRGIDSYMFVLPNSRLIVQVETALDITGCKSAKDCFHTDPEVILPVTAKEYFDYRNANVGDDPSEYLLHEDPFMQKAFALMRERGESADASTPSDGGRP